MSKNQGQGPFGRPSTVTAKVMVGHESQPKPAALTPIGFTGLRAEVRINKAGGFTEVWLAEGLLVPSKSAARPGEKPSEASAGRAAA